MKDETCHHILLVRHAHTAQTGPDAKAWPLSARGRAEAAHLARWSGWRDIHAMVTSTETKAIETAAAITAMHPHIVALPPVPAFGEVDRCGVFVADYEGAVAAFFAQPGASPHGWEPATHACARFTGAIEAVIARYPSASIAVISHGLVLSLYLSTLTDGPPADIAHWRTVPFASVARVACPENRTRLCVHPFILPDISHP